MIPVKTLTAFTCVALSISTVLPAAEPLSVDDLFRRGAAATAAPAGVQPVLAFTAWGGTWSVDQDGYLCAGAGPGPKLLADRPPLNRGEVGVEVLLADDRDGYAGLIVGVSEPGVGADAFVEEFVEVYNRRCQACHGSVPHPNDHAQIWDGRLAWINFTHPELSPALTAHLAKHAGGRGFVTSTEEPTEPLFRDTTDADYARMLGAIETGRQDMLAHPRVDMVQ
jgi:hypothetical protein